MEDVYIWGGMYSLSTMPESRIIDAVAQKLRQHSASPEDLQSAYKAQIAKRKYLDGLFEKQEKLKPLANEQSRLAQSIHDYDIRKAALRVSENTQEFLAASERWRKAQQKKGEWVEELFISIRDHRKVPLVKQRNSTGS